MPTSCSLLSGIPQPKHPDPANILIKQRRAARLSGPPLSRKGRLYEIQTHIGAHSCRCACICSWHDGACGRKYNATVPVTLTVANEYRAVNVTVPASLPVYVINGTVVVADNAKITNNAKSGSVQVTAISVKDGAYKVGSYDSFSGAKSIALKINGCVTKGRSLWHHRPAFPVIAASGNLPLTYFAKVSGDAPNSTDVNAMSVVFTISIVD